MIRSAVLCALSLLAPLASSAPQQWQSINITDEDRAKAPSIGWQRSIADAERASKDSGMPLLLCVCADGENASERFAHVIYKQEDFAALTEGWVPVLLSPNRHTPRDHDEEGRRIPCPRFGSVTCGEHMEMEPIAFDRYFGGERVTPRHVGIAAKNVGPLAEGETAGSREKLFDWFLLQNLSPVRSSLDQYGVRGVEYTITDARQRVVEEARFIAAAPSARSRILRDLASSSVEHPDLLRLALASSDPAERALGLEALGATAGPDSLKLLVREIDFGRDGGELQAVLARMEDSSPAAAREVLLDRQLEISLRVRDFLDDRVELLVLEESPGQQLEQALAAFDTDASAADNELALGRANLAYGREQLRAGQNPSFFFTDARDALRRARDAGADPGLVAVFEVQAGWLSGDSGLGDLAVTAMSAVDAGFHKSLNPAAARAPKLSLTQEERDGLFEAAGRVLVNDLYTATKLDHEKLQLARACIAWMESSEATSAEIFGLHADLLGFVGRPGRRGQVLEAGLRQFPLAASLHERFRNHIVEVDGTIALERAYARLAEETTDRAGICWYTGFATFLVAEERTRSKETSEALAAFDRCIAAFDESVRAQPSYEESTVGYLGLAHTSKARLLWGEDLEQAVSSLEVAFRRAPQVGEWRDGFDLTPRETAAQLKAKLDAAQRDDLARRLEEALSFLD